MESKEDILDIAGPLPIPQFPWSTVFLIGGAVLLLAIIAFIVWRLNRPAPPPLPSARGRALQRLRELRARIGAVSGYKMSVFASDVLRDYLSIALRIPATKQTSPEFLARLQTAGDVAAPQRERITQFLERVDMAKFAHEIPADTDLAPLLDLAVSIVEGHTSLTT